MTFEEDFAWQYKFRDHYAEIALGVVQVAVANWEDDVRRNTDLQVAILDDGQRIACRARRSDYAGRYHGDFTIRYSRPTGVETEWHKMRKGYGDFIIYGFDAGKGRLGPWALLNTHLIREYLGEGGAWRLVTNEDGTAFAAFELEKLPLGTILRSEGHRHPGKYIGPPVGSCRHCSRPVFNVGPGPEGWSHPCCAKVAPQRCPWCSSPAERYGWEGSTK